MQQIVKCDVLKVSVIKTPKKLIGDEPCYIIGTYSVCLLHKVIDQNKWIITFMDWETKNSAVVWVQETAPCLKLYGLISYINIKILNEFVENTYAIQNSEYISKNVPTLYYHTYHVAFDSLQEAQKSFIKYTLCEGI